MAEQHFAWWERKVRRDDAGRPLTTSLWLSEVGNALKPGRFYPAFFTNDALRLGLMVPEDVADPARALTAHCMRHFGEKLAELHHIPSDWINHFRGDAFGDARGHYYRPTPQDVATKYVELVPLLGFSPVTGLPSFRAGEHDEREMHRELIEKELQRVQAQQGKQVDAVAARLRLPDGSEVIVPRRIAPSMRYAFTLASAGAEVRVERLPGASDGQTSIFRARLIHSYERALKALERLSVVEGRFG